MTALIGGRFRSDVTHRTKPGGCALCLVLILCVLNLFHLKLKTFDSVLGKQLCELAVPVY